MHRRLGLLPSLAAVGVLSLPAALAPGAAASPRACAGTVSETIAPDGSRSPSPARGDSCWLDMQPYPFGAEGEPVEVSKNPQCAAGASEAFRCYLTVTSIAFRSWNRGLAATTEGGENTHNAFGVWIFNGERWYPDPTFPGSKTCPGNTVVWAGKLDYWLIGTSLSKNWPSICRFDGVHLAWEPLEIPEATKRRVEELVEGQPVLIEGKPVLRPGGITSGACFAWNNCWFFGTYGTVLHWGGEPKEGEPPLTDVSPSEGWLQGEYTGAVARQNTAGEPFGAAVGAASEGGEAAEVLPPQPDGSRAPQLYSSTGGAFSPLAFAPPFAPAQALFGTDLTAVALDSAGEGWVAGNPAGLHLTERLGGNPQEPSPPPGDSDLSPLVPISGEGASGACTGPPSTRFGFTPYSPGTTAAADSFLWSSIAVIPPAGEALTVVPPAGEALAGGRMRRAVPGAGPDEDAQVGEPVIAQAGCDGTTTLTRFRITDPTSPSFTAPADREGGVTAVSASAPNDAWAATSKGSLKGEFNSPYQPPHLYRLTDGNAPEAPAGDDVESRPSDLKPDKPEEKTVPESEPPPHAPPTTTQTHSVTLPPAIYDVKAKVRTTKVHGRLLLQLYLTFRVRRPTTIGVQALRKGRVVSVARPKHFAGHTGVLILTLDRARWPTKVRFVA